MSIVNIISNDIKNYTLNVTSKVLFQSEGIIPPSFIKTTQKSKNERCVAKLLTFVISIKMYSMY